MRRPTSIRLWAIPALAIAAALIVFLNLFAAHFREFANAQQTFDQTRVLARLIAEPLNLSLQSYILLILGLLFAIYAAYKGYTASDKHPGYEQVHRRRAERADAYAYLQADIRGAIEAVKHAEVVNLSDYPEATAGQLAGLRNRFAALLTTAARDQSLDTRDTSAAKMAIANFRALVTNIRTDGITPKYFNDEVAFDHVRQPLATNLIEPIKLELAAGKTWDDIAQRHKVSAATLNYASLAHRLDKATTAHHQHTSELRQLVTRLLKRIEAANDNIDTIMAAIEKSHVDDTALPDLAKLRTLIDPPAGPDSVPALPDQANPPPSAT